MRIPTPPDIEAIASISPSLYADAKRCLARAAWTAHGDRSSMPPHPRSLLGIAVHHVLERAASGDIDGAELASRRECAREIYDQKVASLFASSHPVLVAKFRVPERLPYYNLYRERAALFAAERCVDARSRSSGRISRSHDSSSRRTAERTLQTADGRLRGRPDLVDTSRSEVVDYKTSSPKEGGIREDEASQLRLYAHLANVNGLPVSKGVILRADRSRVEIQIGPNDARSEAALAIEKLEQLNGVAGQPFDAVATPSDSNCVNCPCIPMCQRFWNEAEASWSNVGVQLQGIVREVRGTRAGTVGIDLDVNAGTASRGKAHVERLTESWLTVEGTSLPTRGEVIRVINLYMVPDSSEPVVYRANREATTCWRVE